MKRKQTTLVFSVLTVLMIAAVLAYQIYISRQSVHTTVFAMDTFVEMKFFGRGSQNAVQALTNGLREMERNVSLYSENSDIKRIQESAGIQYVQVQEQTFRLLEKAKKYSLLSNGTFDLTIAPITLLWDVTGDHPTTPSQEKIQKALSLVNAEDLLLEETSQKVMLKRVGQSVDLGGVAKGAAADMAVQVMKKYDIKNGYVSLGGNLAVRGKNPETGKDFIFGVRDPNGSGAEYFATIPLPNLTMATTGEYERYFEQDGIRYSHVMDPRTGAPVQGEFLSVSVVSADGFLADFLSTALFVAGKETVYSCLDDPRFSIIAVDKDGNIIVSESLLAQLQINPDKPQYRLQVSL